MVKSIVGWWVFTGVVVVKIIEEKEGLCPLKDYPMYVIGWPLTLFLYLMESD